MARAQGLAKGKTGLALKPFPIHFLQMTVPFPRHLVNYKYHPFVFTHNHDYISEHQLVLRLVLSSHIRVCPSCYGITSAAPNSVNSEHGP